MYRNDYDDDEIMGLRECLAQTVMGSRCCIGCNM